MLLAAVQGQAAWYLKIEGVPGELKEGRLAGWTPIQSAGALACLPVNPTNQTTGPVALQCEVRKAFDVTSPLLLQQCGRGEPLRRVTLAYVVAEPSATQFRLTLENALVSSLTQDRSNAPSAEVQEVITFAFDKLEMTSFDLDTYGGVAGGLSALIDQTTSEGSLRTRPPLQLTLSRPPGHPGVLATWPAEKGHRYQIHSRTAFSQPWQKLAESTASTTGPMTQSLPINAPSFFMRVEEVD